MPFLFVKKEPVIFTSLNLQSNICIGFNFKCKYIINLLICEPQHKKCNNAHCLLCCIYIFSFAIILLFLRLTSTIYVDILLLTFNPQNYIIKNDGKYLKRVTKSWVWRMKLFYTQILWNKKHWAATWNMVLREQWQNHSKTTQSILLWRTLLFQSLSQNNFLIVLIFLFLT